MKKMVPYLCGHRTRFRASNPNAFTLIEVLVVVAIIALLIAILLPSLSRAKKQARMVQCQSNLRQLSMAFSLYVVENKGQLPGMYRDKGADWLGRENPPKTPGLTKGRQPEDGTIYKHMGRNKLAYSCPDDNVTRNFASNPGDSLYSYTSNSLIDGAKVETLAGAHYRMSSDRGDAMNFSETNHTANMRPLPGVPILVEEDPIDTLIQNNESGWGNTDCIAARHLAGGNNPGFGNVSFHDTHVARVQLPPATVMSNLGPDFRANSMCMRTTGGKWISGLSRPPTNNDWYGFISRAPKASALGVTGHP